MIINQIFASQQIGFPILSLLLFLPFIAAGLLATMKDEATGYKLAVGACALELALACLVWAQFVPDKSDLQFVEKIGLLAGVSYHLGVDGISMLFIPATAALALLAVVYTDTAVKQNVNGYLAALLAFEGTMMGAFMAVDVMLFWLFFVAEIIPTYILIVHWGAGAERREAASSYLIHMGLASAALLAGIILIAANHSGIVGSGPTFNYVELVKVALPEKVQTVIFFILCLGFAIKAPLFPLHTWLPKVLEQGPVVGMSVCLVGIKLGAYGFLRFVLPLLPQASQEWYWLLAALGTISMVYGALIALVQVDLRRMLAFASVSHMGVVLLGLFSLNFQGMQGGLLQMLNLGITGAGLFFVASFLLSRLGPPDVTRMSGLQKTAPLMAIAFLVIGLAGVGMPGTSGFNGEHLVMLGAFKKHWLMAVAVGAGTFLTAAYFLWYYQRAFLGDTSSGVASTSIADLHVTEKFIAGSLIGIILWIGLFTTPFLVTMNGSIRAIEAHLSRVTPSKTAEKPGSMKQ